MMTFTSDYTFLVDGVVQFGEWQGPVRPKDTSQITETSVLGGGTDDSDYVSGTLDDPND